MAKSQVPFELAGRQFYYQPLEVRPQLKMWPKVARDFGPVLGKLANVQTSPDGKVQLGNLSILGDLLTEAESFLEHIEEYLDVFVKQTSFDRDQGQGQTKQVALGPFQNEVFTGPVVLEFVVECAQIEFADFLEKLFGKAALTPKEEATS